MDAHELPYRLDKTAFHITTLEEQGNDLAYWLQKEPEERLAALEWLRQLQHGSDQVNARLQRVYRITKLQ